MARYYTILLMISAKEILMNVLPTSPDRTATPEQLTRYFNDMRRWNFDVAYSAFYALPLAELNGRFREPYEDFVRVAHRHGYPACVQIQSTVGYLDDVGIENAQYYTDNTTYVYQHFLAYGKKNFFGSFAAPGWLEYMKNISRTLRGFGFDWVVFEEPMLRVDIPGTKDKFHERFCMEYPDLAYPTSQDENVAYLRLQELKAKVLVEFYDKLTIYAREIGFEKCGIMPWFFVPTFENTPMETWNTSCHINKLTFLPNVDFILVRMQPDNIFAEAIIGSGGELIPQISYLENLAQNLGKPIIAVNNPTNEHVPLSADTLNNLLPFEYFARYTLAAAAAAPNGMSRHWYRKDYDDDAQHMELLTKVNACLQRLGSPVSPVALVFSYAGMMRTVPRPWTESWKSFWRIAHDLLYEKKYPVLTFFAETLEESLCRHPETRLLILNEYFPIPPAEVELLERWLDSDPSHRLLYIGAHNGYRFGLDSMYHDFGTHKPPEMLRLFGCDANLPIRTMSHGDEVRLRFAGKEKSDAFLGTSPIIKSCAWGVPVFSKGADVEILYATQENCEPVIFRRQTSRGGYALFAGLATDGIRNDLPVFEFVDFLLRDAGLSAGEYPLIKTQSSGVLWNLTENGFLIISNTGEDTATCRFMRCGLRFWDVRRGAFLRNASMFRLKPLDFRLLKIVGKEKNLLDIEGQIYLRHIDDRPEALSIDGFFRKDVRVFLMKKPHRVMFMKKNISYKLQEKKGYYMINIDIPDMSEGMLIFQFS